MLRRPPGFTLTVTRFPYTALVRSSGSVFGLTRRCHDRIRHPSAVQHCSASPHHPERRSRLINRISTERSSPCFPHSQPRSFAPPFPWPALPSAIPQPCSTAGCSTRILNRSEEHTSELQSLIRISSACCCLKKKKLIH